jgi:hypothetical protein
MVRSSAASSSPRGTREDRTPTLGYGATREAAIAAFAKKLAKGICHDKGDTKLNAQDRVILFCAATGIDHHAVGILPHAMQSMAIRGFIAHNRETGAYALTDSGRATLAAILEDAGLK